MLKKLFNNIALRSIKKDLEGYIQYLECGTEREMEKSLIGVFMALRYLDHSEIEFSLPMFKGSSLTLSDKAKSDLKYVNYQIASLNKSIRENTQKPEIAIMSSGFTPIMFTHRAAIYPEIFADVRYMWSILAKGEPNLEATLNEIFQNITNQEIRKYWPLDNLAIPEN